MPVPLPGDAYVPIRVIAEAFDRPVQTIHTWIRAGIVATRRDGEGVILVSLWDAANANHARARRGVDKPRNP